ncbi:hypothetical protein V2K23_11425 [Pseudomonas alliivorans]|nr:hypothetical protein [Pseudomonas alliivorans]
MIGDLEFDGVVYGKERIPLTLRSCLYVNGAGCHTKKFEEYRLGNVLGLVVTARIPLVYALHSELNGIVSSGGSPRTLEGGVSRVRAFYMYSDGLGIDPTKANACSLYCGWVKSLYKSVNSGDAKEGGCYGKASGMATLLGNATGLGRDFFVLNAGLTAPSKKNAFPQIDKQNLGDAKRFIDNLMDIRNCLGIEAFQRPLPAQLKMSNGQEIMLYSGLTQREQLLADKLANVSLKVRYALYNVRVETELMLFISQTSMNLSDAAGLKFQELKFYTVGDSFEARTYKGRKQGEVIFTAYGEYKPYFLDFLAFRKALSISEHTNLLFGKLPQAGKSVSDNPNPRSLIRLMKRLGRPFVVAGELRKTRQNWLARKAGDPALAAEIGQHDLETFGRYYERPNHQAATTEWSNYYRNSAKAKRAALVGECTGQPIPVKELPAAFEKPNCVNPNLCIFCISYKGIKTYSYIWSILSYKVLREREKLVSLRSNADVSGLESAISRLDQIIGAFETAGKKCAGWLAKAAQQTQMGNYHPRWSGFIHLLDVASL